MWPHLYGKNALESMAGQASRGDSTDPSSLAPSKETEEEGRLTPFSEALHHSMI